MEPLTYGRLWALKKAWVFTVSEQFQTITAQDQVKGRIHTATGTSLSVFSGPWQELHLVVAKDMVMTSQVSQTLVS